MKLPVNKWRLWIDVFNQGSDYDFWKCTVYADFWYSVLLEKKTPMLFYKVAF